MSKDFLSECFGAATNFKNWAYKQGVLSVKQVAVPVISVGNLTVGGTGKTPLIIHLLDHFKQLGHWPGLISRGYGRQGQGIELVKLSKPSTDAITFGDEPTMIQLNHPDIPIVVGGDRVLDAELLLKKFPKTNLILADDAFQHRRIFRNIDIVVLDATAAPEDYQLLPKGRGRESFSSLERADIIFVSKVNLAPVENVKWLRLQIQKKVNAGKMIVEASYDIKAFMDFAGKDIVRPDSVVLVSGIGNPKAFENNCVSKGIKVLEHFSFRDHKKFVESDLEPIIDQAKSLDVPVLVTEKDFVKIRSLKVDMGRFIVARLGIEITKNGEAFYGGLGRVFS